MDCEFQSRLNGFGTTVSEMRPRWRGNRNNLIQLLCELRHVAVVIIRAAHVNQLCGLVLYRLHHLRMAVARRADSHPSITIEKDIAVDIFNPNALRALGNEFEGRSWI